MVYEDLFYPKGVAVIGSATPGKLASVILGRLEEGGCPHLYAVNPKGKAVGSAPGYRSVQEIDGPVSLAVVVSPAATVKDVLEDCGKAGVKAAAIITSGFSEAGNQKGEQEILEVARRYGIRFVGPNCAGVINTHANLLATLETRPPKGSMAVISQSGAVGGALMAMAGEQGVGVSKFLSFGNGLDLNMMEFLEWMRDDDETKVVALYLESIGDGRAFMEALSRLTKKKPVVVVKSGRSQAGQRAALSHTGAMAGADAVFDAALKQCGAVRVDTLEELFDVCKGFSLLPPVEGRRLLIVTNSGGPGVMATDRSEKEGLSLPEPAPALKDALYTFLPAFAGVKNPIDLTVEGTGEQYQKSLCTALPQYDAGLALYIGTPYLKAVPIAEGIAAAAKETKKPLAAVLMVGADLADARQALEAQGIPLFESGERAVETFARMAAYEAWKRDGEPLAAPAAPAGVPQPEGPLLEPEAMDLLGRNGIPVPPHRFVHSAEEAAAGARALGFPVVMKVVSPQILHKSDVGGVVLHIDSEEKAKEAFWHLEKIAEGRDFQGAVLYPMLKGGREVILGLTRDPMFGPVVAFGLGGVYTEALKDVVFRVAPVSVPQAMEMIQSIQSYRILQGIRGEAPADLDALANAIAAFSQLPFLEPGIQEADLNPVFVFEDKILTADARILYAKKEG